jgi:hypothetical protein
LVNNAPPAPECTLREVALRAANGGEASLVRNSFVPRFSIGVTFINKLNPRSLKAHTHKLDLEIIDEFEFKENSYYGLAFLTKR